MDESTPSRICFRCFNPYEACYPSLRVVSRGTLHLTKTLREEGLNVVVEPENGSRLNYHTQKGLGEFLADPIHLLIVGVPVSLVTNLLSSWLYDRFKRPASSRETHLVIEFDDNGNRLLYNHAGEPVSEERLQALLASLNDRAKHFAASREAVVPDSSHPHPIHLEHTGKVVGWAREVLVDDTGLRVDDIRVIDGATWERIQSGELQGLSIAGIVASATCAICGREYVDCNHIAGKTYAGKECVVRINDFRIAEISIVKEPVQPLARIERLARGSG
jgi:NADH:quinone oxidoreductase NDUFS5-like protein